MGHWMSDHMGWVVSGHGVGMLLFWGLLAGVVALAFVVGRATRRPRDKDD